MDGSIDSSFNYNNLIQDTNCFVKVVKHNPVSKKVYIGGNFTNFGGTGKNGIVRLNVDGSIDLDFNPGKTGLQGDYFSIYDIAIQSDGKIIIGGGGYYENKIYFSVSFNF